MTPNKVASVRGSMDVLDEVKGKMIASRVWINLNSRQNYNKGRTKTIYIKAKDNYYLDSSANSLVELYQ